VRILAVVPARGGSKGIPRKNLVYLAGKPLLAYTLEAAKLAHRLDRLVVSTDDHEIAKFSQRYGVETILRPSILADDYASTQSVLLHVIDKLCEQGYRPDAVMTLQPTSPLRTTAHINEAINLFLADPEADSLVSCIEVPHQYAPMSLMRKTSRGYLEPLWKGLPASRRQDKELLFARNGAAIYITKTERLPEYIYGGRLLPYQMKRSESIDIDSPDDLIEVERYLWK